MAEPRTEERRSVITRVELSWQDSSGQAFSHTAVLVDRSFGGAGIATVVPIQAGTRLSIKERTNVRTGTVRYCRLDGREYLVGVQYDEKDPTWARSSASKQTPVPASS